MVKSTSKPLDDDSVDSFLKRTSKMVVPSITADDSVTDIAEWQVVGSIELLMKYRQKMNPPEDASPSGGTTMM